MAGHWGDKDAHSRSERKGGENRDKIWGEPTVLLSLRAQAMAMIVLGVSAVTLGFLGWVFSDRLRRMYLASTLFDEGKIVANFRSMTRPGSFPWREAKRGPNTSHLKTSDGGASPEGHSLPSHFEFKGTRFDLEQWIQDHWMTGLVVLQMPEGSQTEATIMHERYLRGNAREDKVISWRSPFPFPSLPPYINRSTTPLHSTLAASL